MIPSNYPPHLIEMRAQLSLKAFEAWAKTQSPIFPPERITIDGHFDRFFHPETQAAWEGWLKAADTALTFMIWQWRDSIK